jgi:MFS family permease
LAKKNFYGWYILAGGFLILVVDGGVRFSFGVFIKPMVSEFSWERGAITLAYSLNMLVFGLCQPIAGKLLDRFGPKILFSISALTASTGLILTSQISSTLELYLYYGVVTAVGLSGISITVISSTLSRWFKSLRGFVSGIAITGTAFGQFLFIPLIALLMGKAGWRWSWVTLGAILPLVIAPISLVVMRGTPSEIGQEPYDSNGGHHDERDKRDERHESLSEDMSLSSSQIFCSKNFLLTAITYFICGFQDFFFVTQLIPFATDQGLSPQEASNLQGITGFLSVPGLLLFSFLSEKLGRKIPLSLIFLPRILCFSLLLYSYGWPFIYTSALLFGFTLMASAPLASAIMGDLYGLKNIGVLTGTIFWFHHLGGALGAYSGGFLYDLTGTYFVAFIISLCLSVIAALTSISIIEKGS